MTMRSTIQNAAVRAVTVLVGAMTATLLPLMAPPAAQARAIDCVVQPQPPRGACYEPVWVNGQQVIMTFPQAAARTFDNVPSSRQQPFYVLAPQTGTAQGPTPGFFHDHVIATAPREGGFTPFMHGYIVICGTDGIATGACTFTVETPPGGAPLPLVKSVTGYDLTFAADIEAAADAGLVVLVDTGAVFLGTVGPRS
jgi:hypothetical protein